MSRTVPNPSIVRGRVPRSVPRAVAAALAAGLAVGLAVVLVAVPALLGSAAEAKAPDGSHAEVILETHDVTGQPWNASLKGWWGHEGAATDKGRRPTFVSLDLSDGKGVVNDATTAAVNKAMDDGGDLSSLRVAFVPASADGSAERPRVHPGENAGEAFTWFADLGAGTAMNGNTNPNDFVEWVSTLAEYTKWWDAGRPVQGFTDQLKVIDIISDGGTRPAAAPQGRSILDRWPAGTKISMVLYVSDGVDKKMPQVPTVKVGPDGRAETAWLTFRTVASPTNPVRTSGGYQVLTGAGTGPGAAHRPVSGPGVGPATATPGGGATAGATAGVASSATSAGTTPAAASAHHDDGGGITGSLPGGKPTFWVLLVLVVLGLGALATRGLSARGGPPTA